MRTSHIFLLVCGAMAVLASSAWAQMPGKEAADALNWSIASTAGAEKVSCPDRYLATEARCITDGGRACMMYLAIRSAKAGNCGYAMQLSLITQCHSTTGQQVLRDAGQQSVCNYLKAK